MTKNNLMGSKVRHINRDIFHKPRLDRPLLEDLKKFSKMNKSLRKMFSMTSFVKLNKKSLRAPFFLWGFSKKRKFSKSIEKTLLNKYRSQMRKKKRELFTKVTNDIFLKKVVTKSINLKRKYTQLNLKRQRLYLKLGNLKKTSKLIVNQQLKEFRDNKNILVSSIGKNKIKKLKKKEFLVSSTQKNKRKKKLYKQKENEKEEQKPLDPTSKEFFRRRVIKVLYNKKKEQLPIPYNKTLLNNESSKIFRTIPRMLRRTGSPIVRKNFFSNFRFKRSTIALPENNKLLLAQFSRLQAMKNNQLAIGMHNRTMNKSTFILNKRFFNFTVRDMYPNISGSKRLLKNKPNI